MANYKVSFMCPYCNENQWVIRENKAPYTSVCYYQGHERLLVICPENECKEDCHLQLDCLCLTVIKAEFIP